jgi:hypothetical protein
MPCRGEWHSLFHDTDAFPYLQNNGISYRQVNPIRFPSKFNPQLLVFYQDLVPHFKFLPHFW